LSLLGRYCNLGNPEQVVSFIAKHDVSSGTKESLCYAYRKYCKFHNIDADIPFYKADSKPVRIPTNEKLEVLISNPSRTLGTKLLLSKETGLRPIEVQLLKVKDVDLEQRLVYPKTAKHGSSRTLKISNRLQSMIQEHVIRNKLRPEEQLFKGNATQYSKNFRHMRNYLANKLHEPSLATITLYSFRHHFACATYHRTKDLLFTKQQLGHRRIETTMVYCRLIDLNDDDWTSKTATSTVEAQKLIECGFEYVTTFNNIMLFRKRK